LNLRKSLSYSALIIFCTVLIWISPLSLASVETPKVDKDLLLRERIEFKVNWSFIPLVHTFMEVYSTGSQNGPEPTYRLTHQAAMNSFWNDRMESVIDSRSLLPYMMQTIIKDGNKKWREKVVFDRQDQKATFIHQNHKTGETLIEQFSIDPGSMDPLSAFYNLRHRIGPHCRSAVFEGLTGSRRFKIQGKLLGQENVEVPAGRFGTYKIECTLSYWPCEGKEKQLKKDAKDEIKSFTLWVTRDSHRYPVKIRYRLSVGSLWVRAISIQDYDLLS